MFIVDSNYKTIAVCSSEEHARIVAVQEKKDNPNNTVVFLKVETDKELGQIMYKFRGKA